MPMRTATRPDAATTAAAGTDLNTCVQMPTVTPMLCDAEGCAAPRSNLVSDVEPPRL